MCSDHGVTARDTNWISQAGNIYLVAQFICILESQVVRVLDGELLYTKILEDCTICPADLGEISMKQSIGKCKQINF